MRATLRGVARPRKAPTADEVLLMARVKERVAVAEQDYRDCVVSVIVNGSSYSEVSKATGLSTNTLQRWMRQAPHDVSAPR